MHSSPTLWKLEICQTWTAHLELSPHPFLANTRRSSTFNNENLNPVATCAQFSVALPYAGRLHFQSTFSPVSAENKHKHTVATSCVYSQLPS
uniref:Uncharacterized protein n=1 Tax=Ulva partita TaxID=1605170 RepID=A0A1C9ZW83_9CHLO|nr:hypothetical protein [Ulva partita]